MLETLSFRSVAGRFCALVLVASAAMSAFAQSSTNGEPVPAWTNLVVGKGWGTNTHSTSGLVTNLIAAPHDETAQAELRRVLADDDDAQAEADRLLQENRRYRAQGSGLTEEELQLRLRARFIAVRGAYQQFLSRHPANVPALLAYGSLLDDLGEDTAAAEQWEKARALAPENPATWNNLANHYAGSGNELKAFSYYEKAIALATNSVTYQRNLGSAIINLRSNAMAYYSLSEPAVLDKGLQLLRIAEQAQPDDFALATEIAQTLYAIRPPRPGELQAAWRRALELAGDDVEREGVGLHLARVQLLAGKPEEARQILGTVTNTVFAPLRRELEAQLGKQSPAGTTNATAPTPAGTGSKHAP